MSTSYQSCLLLLLAFAVSLDQSYGGVYIRWGRTDCPGCAQKVHSGYTAGSHYNHKGGGSNYICLPEKPSWLNYTVGAVGSRSVVYGTEYEIENSFIDGLSGPVTNHAVPCVVCETPRVTHYMFPGQNQCYTGWTLEYQGYMVAGHHTHSRTEFVCMDAQPDIVPGSSADLNGNLFYLTVCGCGSLPCGPFVANREIACVVCSK